MKKKFEVGKKYKTTVKDFYYECGLNEIGQEFVCHFVDDDGDCWSCDVLFDGKPPLHESGWCVALLDHINSGLVVEAE